MKGARLRGAILGFFLAGWASAALSAPYELHVENVGSAAIADLTVTAGAFWIRKKHLPQPGETSAGPIERPWPKTMRLEWRDTSDGKVYDRTFDIAQGLPSPGKNETRFVVVGIKGDKTVVEAVNLPYGTTRYEAIRRIVNGQ